MVFIKQVAVEEELKDIIKPKEFRDIIALMVVIMIYVIGVSCICMFFKKKKLNDLINDDRLVDLLLFLFDFQR